MPELSESPEAAVLRRLARLHRSEQAPEAARARFVERLAQLEQRAASPAARRPRRIVRAGAGLSLVAIAAAALVWLRGEQHVTPSKELSPTPPAAERVSLSGVAVPGSLRWRDGAAADGTERRECLYRFSLEPEGAPPIEVRWTQCQFPSPLREHTQRRLSPVSGALHVLVVGHWLEPGRLEATELKVLP